MHLPSAAPHYTPYQLAAHVQTRLRDAVLAHKAAPSRAPSPPPVLLSFVSRPTYTFGRRQAVDADPETGASGLGDADMARLTAPLVVRHRWRRRSGGEPETETTVFTPEVLATPRGGLTTYHGPGQVVMWPVLDLTALSRPGQLSSRSSRLTVRDYVCALEGATMAAVRRLYGERSRLGDVIGRTEDPGVWVLSPAPSTQLGSYDANGNGNEDPYPRKLAAVGVHLRRHVSALGTAVNLRVPLPLGKDGADVDDETTNPWRRFVPCGLEGKSVTSVAREMSSRAEVLAGSPDSDSGDEDLEAAGFAAVWADELAALLGLAGARNVPMVVDDDGPHRRRHRETGEDDDIQASWLRDQASAAVLEWQQGVS